MGLMEMTKVQMVAASLIFQLMMVTKEDNNLMVETKAREQARMKK